GLHDWAVKALGTRSRAEDDKSIARSERWLRLSSAVEWMAREVEPPSGGWQSLESKCPRVSWHRKCRRMPRSIRPTRARRPSDASVDPTDARNCPTRRAREPTARDI